MLVLYKAQAVSATTAEQFRPQLPFKVSFSCHQGNLCLFLCFMCAAWSACRITAEHGRKRKFSHLPWLKLSGSAFGCFFATLFPQPPIIPQSALGRVHHQGQAGTARPKRYLQRPTKGMWERGGERRGRESLNRRDYFLGVLCVQGDYVPP